jgi:hypothetical protein
MPSLNNIFGGLLQDYLVSQVHLWGGFDGQLVEMIFILADLRLSRGDGRLRSYFEPIYVSDYSSGRRSAQANIPPGAVGCL